MVKTTDVRGKGLSPRTLLLIIQDLPVFPPVTVAFERSLSKQGTWSKERAWYRSQKEHWLGRLEEYEGTGYHGRKNWLRTAEFIYNHLVCPPMVLWVAEVAGIPRQTLRKAVRAALSAAPYLPAKSSAIRNVISWKEVETLLNASFPGATVKDSAQVSRPQPFPDEALDREGLVAYADLAGSWRHERTLNPFTPKEVAAVEAIAESRPRPMADQALPWAKRLFETYRAGGYLHCQLYDGNLLDDDFPPSANLAAAFGDHFSMYLAIVLYRMSETQRRKLYEALGFFT